jgi:Tfp pilus assembly protein PilV
LPSIRFFSRARTSSQRGFALIAAIALAILYFALIELLLLDSARELSEARRFRARIVASTLAENGAELAAAQMIARPFSEASADDWQGTISGRMMKSEGNQFQITAIGKTKGLVKAEANVQIFGRIIDGDEIRIQYTIHVP